MLQDIAFYNWKWFSVAGDIVTTTLAGIPAWQWEPFDGIIYLAGLRSQIA